MDLRPVTPHTAATSVYANEYCQGRGYSNRRPSGSGDWLLIYTAQGSGQISTPERTVFTRPGDLLLYEPRAAQDYRTAPNRTAKWRLLWAHFLPRPTWQLWMQWPEIGPGVRLLHLSAIDRRSCEDALRRMIRSIRRPGPIQAELALSALEETILLGRVAQLASTAGGTDSRILSAALELTDHFKEPFHLPSLARRCGLSVSRFSHLFRTQLGRTPGQFLEQLRLSHAAQLLRLTTLKIAEVAAECGFENPFYFTRRFRRHHGISPGDFRKRP